ncbi:HNH endonuclease [Psychroflexus montanilacus]|uniref:HNH endonuclease n=1 Tax=Psychroflexus montanilacus TaxID=2873598 RepID=UPI001CCA4CD0|nr:hypothetical protein [Psychroflexus montanilacus]MBZ9650863.1 hypothetical protein [Psychroflexus montanilacus]
MNRCPKCDSSEVINLNERYKYFDVLRCIKCTYIKYIPIKNCCKNPNPKCKLRVTDNGQRFIYEQCENCGGRIKTPPLSFKKFEFKISGLFDINLINKYHENRNIELEELRTQKKMYDLNNSRYALYHIYLASEEWKEKRELVLKRDNNLCQKCKKEDAEDVHHLTYENFGNEKLTELISVCRKCHIEIHKDD